MIVVLVGSSGCGKTTVAKALKSYGFNHAITTTTRKPRKGEKNGVDLNSVSVREFIDKEQSSEFWEVTTYGSELYASPKLNPKEDHVIVLDSAGYYRLKHHYPLDVIGFYLDIPPECTASRLQPGEGQRHQRQDLFMQSVNSFDYIIDANQHITEVVGDIVGKITTTRLRSAV